MRPEDLLSKLKESSTPRTVKTLDVVFQICIEQEQRGVFDFSVATVSRLGQGRGVPKAQSLRNKAGEPYRAILNSFEKKNQNVRSKVETKGDDDWINEIQSSKHKLLVRIQAAELASARKKLRDFVPPGSRIEVRDYQNEDLGVGGNLFPQERRALEYLVSKEFLDKWGFSISEYGEIMDRTGCVVLRAGTVDAVKKALNYL